MVVIRGYFIAALAIGLSAVGSIPSLASTPVELPVGSGFTEPLVATKATSPSDDLALSAALAAYARRQNPSDISSLTNYLSAYPHTGWSTALWTNLGFSYLHDGYFSRARAAWRRAWAEGRDASAPAARAVTDRAIGELAMLDADLGDMNDLSKLFDELGSRDVSGPATETIQAARETLALVTKDPRHLFNCGPLALRSLLLSLGVNSRDLDYLEYYNSGPDGTSLAELSGLADRVKFQHRLIARSPGKPVPVPSVVHWKLGHFAAIIGKANGRYHVQDAVFPNADIWVTPAALDAESSGYYLVPAIEQRDRSWKEVASSEAALIRGRGQTNSTRSGGAGDPNASAPDSAPPPPNVPGLPSVQARGQTPIPPKNAGNGGQCPLCVVNIKESSVSIALSDTPVGYVPPIGPSMKIGISYNQREDSQPANFNYYNVSQKWTLNWLSYVVDDPTNPGANVSRIMGEGGAFYYLGYDPVHRTFAAQDTDGSVLALVSQSPVIYRRQLRDGSYELYQQSDSATAYPRHIFLSQVIDPQGNAATLHYDSQQRLTSITDAVGRDTTFSYKSPGRPLLVTAITDPFGRSAKLTYDGTGRLSSITDIIGLTSSFTYDGNSLIDSLTTPYGTTHFAYSAPGTAAPPRFAQITDPLGYKEREEWLEPAPIPDSDPASTVPVGMPVTLSNVYLIYRNSFHWDKKAYIDAGCTDTGGCDYTKARLRHFVHMPGSTIKGTAIESQKNALENRVWYTYPGQTSSIEALYGGTYDKPTAIGRVLDDGTSQVSRYSYDDLGNLTQATDPSGRVTYYAYTDGIDVAAVTQGLGFGTRTTLAQFVYNGVHRPILATDAAGKTSSFDYNATGQMTSFTDALGEKTSYHYDANANLASITNPNNATAATYTYDGFDRIRTYTDSEGWSVTYDYDAADRITRITYPDGTARQYTYDKLDLVSYQDREGRRWSFQYDANRRLTSTTDPIDHSTGLAYDGAGNLLTLTDPKGNPTSWGYDVESRPVSKTYADTSSIAYIYENTTSRLKSTLDPVGQTKQYSYAIDDNLTGLTYLNAVNPTPNVTFTYDPNFSRIASMTDGVGTTVYGYNPSFVDGAQQLAQECFTAAGATGCSHTITYGYDDLGRPASRQISGSGAETFQYDTIGRLSNHTSDLGAFQLSYLGQTPQLTQRQLLPATSTLKTTWSYLDNAHDRRLAGIANTGLTSGQFTNFTFETTPENYITGITQDSDAAIAEPSPAAQTVSFNNLNEITAVSSQAYSYDANGNLISDGDNIYSWDAENRLVRITHSSAPAQSTLFDYDGLGRRVEIDETQAGDDAATVSKFVWCGSSLCQMRDALYGVARHYFREGEYLNGTPTHTLFYGRDQVGSVRRVFEDFATATSYDYDPWGEANQSQPLISDFGFAGMFSEPVTKLSLTLYRAYNPKIGRWLSRDSAGESRDSNANLYTYSLQNPLRLIDRLGLDPVPEIPSSIPGGPWTPANGQRQGAFFGPRQPSGPRAQCQWVPPQEQGGPAGSTGYWKTQAPGQKGWDRFNRAGEPISAEEAHPGNVGASGQPPAPETEIPEIPEIPEVPEFPIIEIP